MWPNDSDEPSSEVGPYLRLKQDSTIEPNIGIALINDAKMNDVSNNHSLLGVIVNCKRRDS